MRRGEERAANWATLKGSSMVVLEISACAGVGQRPEKRWRFLLFPLDVTRSQQIVARYHQSITVALHAARDRLFQAAQSLGLPEHNTADRQRGSSASRQAHQAS